MKRPQPRLVLLGKQGAGKGTQAERLAEHYGITHISTGDMFRAQAAQGTAFGLEAKRYMDEGELVPDEIVMGVFEECIVPGGPLGDGFVLDGFLGVVVALGDVAAAGVARPRNSRRQVDVVHALTVVADAPARDSVEDDLAWDLEVDGEIEGRRTEHAIELTRLGHGAREPVEHEAVAERPAGHDALLEDAHHDLVGDELALVHVPLCLEPKRGTEPRLRAEDLAGRQVHDGVVIGEPAGLGSLAGTLLAEQHEARRRPPHAQLRNPS